jgi:hypothetical protein
MEDGPFTPIAIFTLNFHTHRRRGSAAPEHGQSIEGLRNVTLFRK